MHAIAAARVHRRGNLVYALACASIALPTLLVLAMVAP